MPIYLQLLTDTRIDATYLNFFSIPEVVGYKIYKILLKSNPKYPFI